MEQLYRSKYLHTILYLMHYSLFEADWWWTEQKYLQLAPAEGRVFSIQQKISQPFNYIFRGLGMHDKSQINI